MSPSPSARRRPPRPRAGGGPRPDEGAGGRRRALGPSAFRGVLVAGAVLPAGVLVIAAATDTADGVPGGAIIGVAAIMVLAFFAGRRRAWAFDRDDDA